MNVQETIIKLITQKFPNIRTDKLDLSQPLENQGIDSLDLSDLLFALERIFGRRVATSQVSSLRSVQDVVQFFSGVEKEAS